jgi:hypothetical protein
MKKVAGTYRIWSFLMYHSKIDWLAKKGVSKWQRNKSITEKKAVSYWNLKSGILRKNFRFSLWNCSLRRPMKEPSLSDIKYIWDIGICKLSKTSTYCTYLSLMLFEGRLQLEKALFYILQGFFFFLSIIFSI